MSRRQFEGMDCAYCNKRKAITGDHIFARSFFLVEHRDNLPQVPSCDLCNNEKAKLECYLSSLLPFGGRHAHAKDNLNIQVPKRLKKNKRLHGELSTGRIQAQLTEGGSTRETLLLPIDEGTIEGLFEYIVKGLMWFHWKVYCPDTAKIDVTILTPAGQKIMQEEIFSLRSVNRVSQDLGSGTVIYEGVQDGSSPDVSAWRFHMYGGMMFAGDLEETNMVSTEIGAFAVRG